MNTRYFRTTTNEYCHISDDTVFIFNTKEPNRIPLEHELWNAWSVKAILNYIVFVIMLLYTMMSVTYYGAGFFLEPVNYGALLILLLAFIRMKENMISSNTPTIPRSKIRNAIFKTPRFSYPRLVIYFNGPEGKVLRRTISVKYKKEALPVLEASGLIH
jgi:hypothetical protein